MVRISCLIPIILFSVAVAMGQTAESYSGVSVSADGSTVYAYTVTETETTMNAPCTHTYSAGIAFSTSDQFPNFSPEEASVPAAENASVRQDASVVLDGNSTYYVQVSNSAYCSCKGSYFYVNYINLPLQKVRAYYYCDWTGTACTLTSSGQATYHRCNKTSTTICNTIFATPLNGATPPHYALKTVYQIQIGPVLVCSGLQTADQKQSSCLSPDPIP